MNAKEITEILKECTKLKNSQISTIKDIILGYDESDALVYEAIGLLNEDRSFLQVKADFAEGKFKWESKHYESLREKRELHDVMLAKPPELREGEIECPKCHKKKTLVVEMQTRSADEGYTYYIHCFNPICKAITK